MDHHTATIDDLVGRCQSSGCEILCAISGGTSVVKISDHAVIKFGQGITEDEWLIHKKAFDMIDRRRIRVPQPYRYFARDEIGYLVMEYLDGKPVNPLDSSYSTAVSAIFSHLWEISCDTPGSLSGGASRGVLWSDYHDFVPRATSDLEAYFNVRLPSIVETRLDLSTLKFVLCHGDLAARNILTLHDGSICLIDWATAGFYPRIFDICSLQVNGESDRVDIPELITASEIKHLSVLYTACARKERFVR